MSQQINLFNPLLLKKRQLFCALMVVEILGVVLLSLIFYAVYANWQFSILRNQAAASAARLGAMQTQVTALKTAAGVRQKNPALESDIVATENEIKSLQQVFALLKAGEFGNTQGYSTYMRAFSRQIISGVWLTGFHIQGAGNEIGLQGRTTQAALVPAYINQLKREEVMRGASFATLEMHVPQVDATKTDPAARGKPGVPAAYIEFSLLSSGLLKMQPEPAGARPK